MHTDLFRYKNNEFDLDLIYVLVKYVGNNLDAYKGDAKCCDFDDRIQLMKDSFSGKITVYCTHYAMIYSLMANDLGLQTRLVHIRPQDPNFHHVVVESYVKELGDWVMVDPTYGHEYFIHVSHETTNYLDTVEALSLFSEVDIFSLPENERVMLKVDNQLIDVKHISNDQKLNLEEQMIYFKNLTDTQLLYE